MPINLTNPELTELRPRIVVFGVGGAGGNAVNNMIDAELQGVEFVAANTDAQALAKSRTANQIQLGAGLTQGLGAGAQPDVGRGAAEEAMEQIMQHLEGCHMCFITAGMGGGTGTGAAPVIARAAREAGILTVGVVTKPFQFEGKRRMAIADGGVQELQANVDTLIVIPNQNLFRVANEKTTFADAFKIADEVLHSGVRSITDLMVEPGLINLDFADVRTVMHEMGKAMMGTGEAEGEDRARKAAQDAIANPLLEDMSLKTARGVLINVTGGMDLTLHEVDEAASLIREEVDEDANIIIGSILDPELDGRMRVSVVATGIDMIEVAQSQPSQGFTPRVVASAPARSIPARTEAPRPQAQPGYGGRAGGAATAMAMQPECEIADPETGTVTATVVAAAEDDVAAADIFRDPAPEPEYQPVRSTEPARPAPAAAKPKFDFRDDIPTFPTRTREAAFMPQKPQTAATVDRVDCDPVPQPAQGAPEGKSPAKRLIDRLTGRGRTEAARAEATRRPLFPNRTEAELERARREPTMPGLDLGEPEPKKPSRVEDDLDIPAFLRRQAN